VQRVQRDRVPDEVQVSGRDLPLAISLLDDKRHGCPAHLPRRAFIAAHRHVGAIGRDENDARYVTPPGYEISVRGCD
jgi:hypothetical protein